MNDIPIQKDGNLDALLVQLKEQMMKEKPIQGQSEKPFEENMMRMTLNRSPDKKGVFWAY